MESQNGLEPTAIGKPPQIRFDEHGHAIPFTPEELKARTAAILRMLDEMAAIPDDSDGCSDVEIMRAIDEGRPERPLFREYYTP